MPMTCNRYTLICIVWSILLVTAGGIAGPQKRVLFVSSYHPGFPTFFEQVNGIKSGFDGNNILLDIEFMDSKRLPGKEQQRLFQTALAYKLGHTSAYDAVIVADDNALLFAVDNQDRLFKDIPIVFLGVNNIETAMAQNGNDQITGVVEAVSVLETIELMVKLCPRRNRIVAIVDNTPSGQGDLKKFYKAAEHFKGHQFSQISLATTT